LNRFLDNQFQIPSELNESNENRIVDLVAQAENKFLIMTIDKCDEKELIIDKILGNLEKRNDAMFHHEVEERLANNKMIGLLKGQIHAILNDGLTFNCGTRCLLKPCHTSKKSQKFMMNSPNMKSQLTKNEKWKISKKKLSTRRRLNC
jgi:hypothetical protein